MGQQIKIFEQNKIDISNDNCTLTVTDSIATDDGQLIVNYIRNRNNNSAWLTTGSTDAANTSIEMDMADSESIDHIILISHNFKNYTIQKWNGSAYEDFSPAIAVTNGTATNTQHTFTEVATSKIKIVITACQVTDDDKVLKQMIVSKLKRQFTAFPEVSDMKHDSNRTVSKMLSGKNNFIAQVGSTSVTLSLDYWSNDSDLIALEQIFLDRLPVLVWVCGGDETQFKFRRVGYRMEDIYLMRPSNDYSPQWFKSVYTTGIKLKVNFVEVVD